MANHGLQAGIALLLRRRLCFLLMGAGIWLFHPATAEASLIEQMAIDTKAISMANTVTANPPGHLSIHYNPAGLSKLPEGSWWNQGASLPFMTKEGTFRGNEDFPGWLWTKRWDHHSDPIYQKHPAYGDEGREEYSADDLKAKGHATSGVMYLPLINRSINFAISPRTALANRAPGSKWTFATGMYAPYATGFNHGYKGDPHRFGGKRAFQSHLIYQAPTAAYQINPNLSVGIGIGIGQTSMGAEFDIRSPSDLTALTRELGEATKGMAIPPWTYLYYEDPLYGGGLHPWEKVADIRLQLRNDFTPSCNMGVLYEPYKWLGLGLVYQSEIRADMHGNFKLRYGEDWRKMVRYYDSGPWGVQRTSMILDLPRNPIPYQAGVVTTTVKFPQRVQGGLRYSPNDRLHLMFDLKWAEWSIRDQDVTKLDQDIQLLKVAKLGGHKYGDRTLVSDRFMKDSLDWGVAMEYNLSQKIDLHMGYEFRESSVNTQYMDLTSALPDLHNFGIGGAYHLANGGRLDFGLGYLFGYKKIAPEQSKNLTSTDIFEDQTNLFAGQYFHANMKVILVSVGFMIPFDAYVTYQKGNREKIKQRIRFLNPFTRVND